MAAIKSSPHNSSASPESSPEATMPEQTQPPMQKRKGGRKPVYATQEERKMRNRAAQAAFRERRTEYIKHLEATIKQHEETLSSLQQSSRNAADEVLMLRYKNSLLERILLEKGINVTAELRAFAQYNDRPSAVPQPALAQTLPAPQAPHVVTQQPSLPQQHLHRAVVSRQNPPPPPQPKRELVNAQGDTVYIKESPDSRVAPTSRSSSVAAAIPTPPDQSAFHLSHNASAPTSPADFHPGMPMAQSYYPSPYQAHMEELEQEYNAELLEATDGAQSPLDQQPTPDGNDNEMNMSGVASRHQQGPYNVGSLFDTSFDSMFADQTAQNSGGLTDMARQYNHQPFSFVASNLR